MSAASPPRTRPLTTYPPRSPAVLKRLSDPPQVIVVNRDGARIAEANPTALVFDRQAGSIRRDRHWRSTRSRRIRELLEFVLSAFPRTEIDRADAMKAMHITDTRDFSTALMQINHTLKPYGIGARLFHGGRVVIVEQEASAC